MVLNAFLKLNPCSPTPLLCPGVIRQQKAIAPAQDVQALPVVVSDKPAPSSVLARTTSGSVISAPTERLSDGESSLPQRAASASLASSGPPFRTKAPPSGATATGGASQGPGASPLAPSKQASGGVALTASAGPLAAEASARSTTSGGRDKQAQLDQVKAIEQQISRLEKQAGSQAGAEPGATQALNTGPRPSDFSLRERQLVARQRDVTVAPALDKTLSGVQQRPTAAAQQGQRRSMT